MKPEKICANCVHCTRENYCLHRQGPYKTWDENYCNNFESKEKDNETMNEELRKKYGNMTIDDMIEKMEEQEMWIKALEQDGRNYRNELLENRARISDLERAYDRVYEENATFVKRNEALDKRATELVKSVEEKDERIKDLEDRLAIANRSITSYHSEIKKTREKDAELVKSVEEKDEQIEKLKNELDEANAEIGELGGRITERHATNRELAKNCVRLETENREKEAKIASLTQELADKKNQIWRLNEDIAKYCEDTNPKIGTLTARLTFKENQVKDLNKKLEEKNEVIDKMEDQIEELNERLARNSDVVDEHLDTIKKQQAKIEYLENHTIELQKSVAELGCRYPVDTDTRITINNLKGDLNYWNRRALTLDKELNVAKDRIKDLKSENDDLLNNLGEASKEVEEKRTLIIKLESERKDKECRIADLTHRLEDKDDVIADLQERLDYQKHIILNYERDIVRYSKSDEEKIYLENDIAVTKTLANLQKAINTCCMPTQCPVIKSAIEAYSKKCEEEAKPKLNYK